MRTKILTLWILALSSQALADGKIKASPNLSPGDCAVSYKTNEKVEFKSIKMSDAKKFLPKFPKGDEGVICGNELKKSFGLETAEECQVYCNNFQK